MVAVAGKIEKTNAADPFIKCASIAISNIDKTKMQKLASKALAKVKEEIRHSDTSLSNWPSVESLHEARSGNTQKAYAIVSGLGQNFYVDHKSAAYEQVFNDALKRGDLKTAIFFAERPVRKMPHHEMSVWQKLAEKQTELGDHHSASESYRKASSYLNGIISSRRIHLFDIKNILSLGDSIFRASMKEEGHRIILLAKSLIDRIPERRIDDRIKASIFVSESLWNSGIQEEAKKLIQQAYFYAHLYDKDGKRQKARLLSAIGQSLLMFSEMNPTTKRDKK